VTAAAFRRSPSRLRVFFLLFLCGASHGVFDAMTDGGRGVALLAPFDWNRFFLPWRPIRVSPIGIGRFLGPRGLAILASELRWIWIPCAAIGALGLAVRGSERSPRENA
jgi:inner membrane protein